MQIKISLFFLHSLRVPKVIPLFGVREGPGVFGAEAAPFPWVQADCAARMDLFVVPVRMCWAESGLVCAWLSLGVTKTLAGAKSPHVSAHEAGSGGDWGAAPYRHQFTPSSSGVHRAEKNPTRAGCQPQ